MMTRREWVWLGVALMGVIFAGAFFASGYGRSTDEYANYEYARNSLRAFLGDNAFIGPSFDELHGPFHLEVAYLFGRLASSLPVGWTPTDARHFANFAIFVLGLGGLYVLARRLVGPFPAALTAALLATQPMVLGQAFVNQKDAPFLAYFTLSIAVGLLALDRLKANQPQDHVPGMDSGEGLLRMARREFAGLSRRRQMLLAVGILILAWLIIDTFFGLQLIAVARHQLSRAYQGLAWPVLQAWFDRVATDAYKTPFSLYVQKLNLVYDWMKAPLLVIEGGGLVLFLRWQMPSTVRRVVKEHAAGVGGFVAAGLVLGVSDSVRVAAPLAGVLISADTLVTLGERGIVALVGYWGAAAWATYLTWPWLWQSPLASYWQSLRVMAAYPSHEVLYAGSVYSSQGLPWDYVPRLIGLQTTEVVVPLSLAGLAVAIWRVCRNRVRTAHLLGLMIWLVFPIVLVMLLHSSLYGNLRQMLFILPPLFLLAGVALDALLARLASTAASAAVLLILIPGIVGIVRLHPYEYTYFNGWVGGVSGAYGQYQVDPWCTSYRQAISYVNAVAPRGAVVDVRGPVENAAPFSRPDLVLRPDYSPDPTPAYVLMCQVDVQGDTYHDELPVIYRVAKGKAVFAVVRGRP